jgi:hypothetical protein
MVAQPGEGPTATEWPTPKQLRWQTVCYTSVITVKSLFSWIEPMSSEDDVPID